MTPIPRSAREPRKPRLLPSPVALAVQKVGGVEIIHRQLRAGEEVAVIGMRQAFLRGKRSAVAVLAADRRVHMLRSEEDGVWMTDLPEELNQIDEMLQSMRPQGRVLLGGYGLGCTAEMVAKRSGVTHIDVVERSAEVIELAQEQIASTFRCRVIEGDLYAFLQSHPEPYDFYLLDTWQGTSEATWWEEVLPAKRTIRNRWGAKPKIHCWAEDIMRGQVESAIVRGHYKGFPQHVSPREASLFCSRVGLPAWEDSWGRRISGCWRSTARARGDD